jgi:lysozyme
MKRKFIATLSVIVVAVTTLISAPATAAVVKKIAGLGPGSRIYGLDISRWQHPSEKSIDFRKMYKAGVRFVIIKGSDANDPADASAFKYLKIDRPAAQSAGIYTGFYHYATLPDSTDPTFIITDAQAQAQKVVWRLASIGGYTRKDLPLALDLENNCVRVSSAANV